MTKQDFLDQLRKSIASINDYEFVNDTMAYYEDYIESEIRKGRTEKEILEQLGSPRLIAKSIMATHDFGEDENAKKDYQESSSNEKVFSRNGKVHRIPLWLYKLFLLICAIFVIGLAFIVLQWLAPVIVIAVLTYILYKFIKNNFT